MKIQIKKYVPKLSDFYSFPIVNTLRLEIEDIEKLKKSTSGIEKFVNIGIIGLKLLIKPSKTDSCLEAVLYSDCPLKYDGRFFYCMSARLECELQIKDYVRKWSQFTFDSCLDSNAGRVLKVIKWKDLEDHYVENGMVTIDFNVTVLSEAVRNETNFGSYIQMSNIWNLPAALVLILCTIFSWIIEPDATIGQLLIAELFNFLVWWIPKLLKVTLSGPSYRGTLEKGERCRQVMLFGFGSIAMTCAIARTLCYFIPFDNLFFIYFYQSFFLIFTISVYYYFIGPFMNTIELKKETPWIMTTFHLILFIATVKSGFDNPEETKQVGIVIPQIVFAWLSAASTIDFLKVWSGHFEICYTFERESNEDNMNLRNFEEYIRSKASRLDKKVAPTVTLLDEQTKYEKMII